jgi:dipeptidyl aminopeptidase/acylaminoacyl peptidase
MAQSRFASTGGSITQPRFSPDGRSLLFTVSEYSDFPIHQVHSDLHMMDITTGRHSRLSINSDRCQAWHGWSSNGRWIVFNGKAMDGRFSRIFFSHVDSAGVASKPFVLPQQDPEFYSSSMLVYNVPELITQPIRVPARKFREAMMAFDKMRSLDAVGSASAGEYRDEGGKPGQ